MTAMDAGMGCNTQVDVATELFVGGSTITVNEAVLAAHGVYVAWGSNDEVQTGSSTVTSSFSTIATPEAYTSPEASPAPQSSESVARSTSSESTETSFSSEATRSGSGTIPARTASTLMTAANRQSPPSTVTVVSTHSPAQPTQTSSSLSTGAKAGVGVGVSVGGIALVAAAVWFGLGRRRRQQGNAYLSSQPEIYDANADSSARSKAHHVSELSTEGGRSELSGTLPWIEATPKERRAELEGQ